MVTLNPRIMQPELKAAVDLHQKNVQLNVAGQTPA